MNVNDFEKDFLDANDWFLVFDIFNHYGKVDREKGIIFEIRTKEQGHNAPHVHAKYQEKEVSISLKDFSVLDGNLPQNKLTIAIAWVKKNIDKLSNMWDKYHCYSVRI